MAMQTRFTYVSTADYLAGEEQSPRKREYVDGVICAMTGARRSHHAIAARLVRSALNAADNRKDCQVFGSDMKVHVQAKNSIYYPDLSATCDPTDNHDLYLVRPCFIVEVLSPSTATIDRREKRAAYCALESLREYLIVDSTRMRAELYRREDGIWQGYLLNQPDDIVESLCLGLRLTLQQIYEGVELPPPGVAEEEAPEYEVSPAYFARSSGEAKPQQRP